MKAFTLIALATSVTAHSIFQKVSVNGADQGQLKGVRAPTSNNPIQNVGFADFACNTGIVYKDNTVIKIPAGAKVGAWWGHEIGGASGPNDADNPIAASHKGMLFTLSGLPPRMCTDFIFLSQAPSQYTSPRLTMPPPPPQPVKNGSRSPSAG